MKLVRDRIIDIITRSGKIPIYHIATDEDMKYWLMQKLKEEVFEFIEYPCVEEMADIMEVLEAIRKTFKIPDKDVESVKKEKCINNGAFENRIILNHVEDEKKC